MPSLHPFTFLMFLSLVIKLVKMWPGGTLHVVVGTLKISLDRLKKKIKKNKNTKRSFVEPSAVVSVAVSSV